MTKFRGAFMNNKFKRGLIGLIILQGTILSPSFFINKDFNLAYAAVDTSKDRVKDLSIKTSGDEGNNYKIEYLNFDKLPENLKRQLNNFPKDYEYILMKAEKKYRLNSKLLSFVENNWEKVGNELFTFTEFSDYMNRNFKEVKNCDLYGGSKYNNEYILGKSYGIKGDKIETIYNRAFSRDLEIDGRPSEFKKFHFFQPIDMAISLEQMDMSPKFSFKDKTNNFNSYINDLVSELKGRESRVAIMDLGDFYLLGYFQGTFSNLWYLDKKAQANSIDYNMNNIEMNHRVAIEDGSIIPYKGPGYDFLIKGDNSNFKLPLTKKEGNEKLLNNIANKDKILDLLKVKGKLIGEGKSFTCKKIIFNGDRDMSIVNLYNDGEGLLSVRNDGEAFFTDLNGESYRRVNSNKLLNGTPLLDGWEFKGNKSFASLMKNLSEEGKYDGPILEKLIYEKNGDIESIRSIKGISSGEAKALLNEEVEEGILYNFTFIYNPLKNSIEYRLEEAGGPSFIEISYYDFNKTILPIKIEDIR